MTPAKTPAERLHDALTAADCRAPVARRTLPPWWEYQEEPAKVDLAAVDIGGDAANDGEVG